MKSFKIIQGGMGVNISNWFLARTVSLAGQLGTLSGVALEKVMVIMLQNGDADGHIRRALSHFPFPHISEKVLREYYVEGGVKSGATMKKAPFFKVQPSDSLIELAICANFAFVWLAKEGHSNPISVNFLEKIAMPHLYAVFGAMLAGVDFVTVGAGIPLQFPEMMTNFVEGKEARYIIPVAGEKVSSWMMSFDPGRFFGSELKKLLPLEKPGFLPIIASNLLATILKRRLPDGSIAGFVVEEPTAGGHNAPPRKGEAYGPFDVVDYEVIAEFGLPFWIGGSYASPEALARARSVGARGIQVGSIFALSEESGMQSELRREIRRLGWLGQLKVRTDRRISPSGFPFKVVELKGTIGDEPCYLARVRRCDRGALQSLYERDDGTIGYRCASESMEVYIAKGGSVTDTTGRGCLCNGLLVTAGLNSAGDEEPAVVTLGDDVSFLRRVMPTADSPYCVNDVLKYLLGEV